MNSQTRISLALLCVFLTSGAAALDTSAPILCVSIDINECVDGAECKKVLAEEVNAPTFMRIDLKNKQLLVRKDGEPTEIEHVEEIEGRIVMQGVEEGNPNVDDGTGWTLTIEKDTARMVATVSMRQAAVVMFGACTEL